MPKFSIIIPAHNSEPYIRHALDSVRAQSFKDYELLVICDRCTDSTAEIASEYTELVYSCDFGNDGLTRNVGLNKATGDWILFMDDDDWYLHEFVLKQLSDRLDIYADDDLDCLMFSFIFAHIGYAEPYGNNGGHIWPNVWNKAWRRDFIGETRFQPIPMASDMQFVIDNMAKCPQILSWDMPLYYYNYMRVGSQTEVQSRDRETIS